MKERENIKDYKLYRPSQADMDDERSFIDSRKEQAEREDNQPSYLMGAFGYDMNACRPNPGNRERGNSITIHEEMIDTLSIIEETDNEASSPEKNTPKHEVKAIAEAKTGHINDYKDLGDKDQNGQNTRDDVIGQGTSQVDLKPAEAHFNRLTAARSSYKEGLPLKSLLRKL